MLDKDIVNMNENCINYIQSNPKFVQTVNELAVTDMGTMGNYLNLDLPCNNKQQAVHPLPIQIPNGEIITSTHTDLLSNKYPPIEVQKAHIFPVLNKAFLSIETFCDHVCQAIIDEKTVFILSKGSGKVIIKG